MKKTILVITFVVLAFVLLAEDDKPNILVLISDDHNANTVGCYNNLVSTPSIDRLAREGILFTRAYTNAALCVPTRYACLTGSYASRCLNKNYGPLTNQAIIANGAFFTENELTIAMALKNAGYYTGATGKWHNASNNGSLKISDIPKDADPKDEAIIEALQAEHQKLSADIKKFGFDYANYLTHGNLDLYPDALAHHNVEYTVKGAIEFLEQAPKNKPFFLWTAFTTTHGPREIIDIADKRMTPEGYTVKHLCIRPEVMSERSELIAECSNPEDVIEQTVAWMDNGIEVILKKLDAMGIADNTIVIFLSDQQNIGKSTTLECGQKIPFIIRYPALVQAGSVEDALDITDMAATILDLAEADPVDGMHMDGRSLASLLNGSVEKLKTAIFSEMGYTKAVVTEDLKYIAIRYPQSVLDIGTPPDSGTVAELSAAGELYMLRKNTPWGQKTSIGLIDPDQLYDLRNDPDEEHNLADHAEYAGKLAEMKLLLSGFIQEIGRPFGEF